MKKYYAYLGSASSLGRSFGDWFIIETDPEEEYLVDFMWER